MELCRKEEGDMADFEEAFWLTLALEGGYSNMPSDPGGETKFGICKREYPNEDIKNLTVARAKFLYKRDYWDKVYGDYITGQKVANELFDTAVNQGPGTSTECAQLALKYLGEKISVDRIFGNETLTLLNKWCERDERALFKCLNGFQFMRYVEIVCKVELTNIVSTSTRVSAVFSRGWTKRLQDYYTIGG